MLFMFYINYQFLEANYLKRRFAFNLILQIILKFLLIFSYYINLGSEIKNSLGAILGKLYIITIFIGLLFLYDYLIYRPYFNS